MNPLLAVTMGDPAGVGAEIVVKALSRPEVYSRAQPFVIGNAACLKSAMLQTGLEIPIVIRSSVTEVTAVSDILQVLEPVEFDFDRLQMGQVNADCGHAAVQFFESSVKMALAAEIDGVVTCPINKEAVQTARRTWSAMDSLMIVMQCCTGIPVAVTPWAMRPISPLSA